MQWLWFSITIAMATSTLFLSSLIQGRTTPINSTSYHVLFLQNHNLNRSVTHRKRVSFSVQAQAAKPPAGVEFPKVQPQFKAPFLGFTKTAEVWNSRACMIGLIGTFIVELIINKGILQVIGVEIGKGLDLPL
ncbi:hypothetical protein Lal_00041936 [Lupinus albus]|uniref:Putative chlorophyll a/b binding protein n=1 Tax=Lupinus albus TaxID=3870 RepID=A0A6A4QTE1_LUPAL|nr:putative chlorophyll a/b binding protein [Lupinus albus]KAF1895655.1 hypothetical protein Lal_00041936 [Lupinus albus]